MISTAIQTFPKTADTLEGNALLKSSFIFNNYGLDCFADDTGLEVEALDGAPGFIPHATQAEKGTTHKPICSNYSMTLKERRTARRNSAPRYH